MTAGAAMNRGHHGLPRPLFAMLSRAPALAILHGTAAWPDYPRAEIPVCVIRLA